MTVRFIERARFDCVSPKREKASERARLKFGKFGFCVLTGKQTLFKNENNADE